jgi:N6-L-threonylcarbamoyladenine synthase
MLSPFSTSAEWSVNATVLAIDTSCDDTSAAIVRGTQILASVVRSQNHAAYGGVFPTVAKAEHSEFFSSVVDEALAQAHVSWSELSAIAVTQGPGLAPTLEVGISKVKELAAQHQLPIIPVHHIEGHVWSWSLGGEHSLSAVTFPTLALVISGGHTDFILVKNWGEYERLGWTVDDAAGEAIDKVGRLLGLEYPAGAKLEKLAADGDDAHFEFPLPMTKHADINLSFAGLKTAATRYVASQPAIVTDEQLKKDFAASFQRAVFRHVTHKLQRILDQHEISELWLGGGVAANQTLRTTLQDTLGSNRQLRSPELKYCLDNAAMIGLVGWQKWKNLGPAAFIQPEKLERTPSWPIESWAN